MVLDIKSLGSTDLVSQRSRETLFFQSAPKKQNILKMSDKFFFFGNTLFPMRPTAKYKSPVIYGLSVLGCEIKIEFRLPQKTSRQISYDRGILPAV
jgi:hypothetical protein